MRAKKVVLYITFLRGFVNRLQFFEAISKNVKVHFHEQNISQLHSAFSNSVNFWKG